MRCFAHVIPMLLFCTFGLYAQLIDEEEIKNSGKYLFEENYDNTEETARQNAYESLKKTFEFRYPQKNIAVLNHNVRHLITKIGYKVQAIAFVPLDSLEAPVKITPEIISMISDSCSLAIAKKTISNEKLRLRMNENASQLFRLLNWTMLK